MIQTVIVIGPVIVAALVNGNDIVEVIDAVDAPRSHAAGVRWATCSWRMFLREGAGLDHDQGFVPAHERGHDHG